MQIRLADESEAIEILSEPDTVARTGKKPEHMMFQPWIIEDAGKKMMFVFWSAGEPKTYEVHIATLQKDRDAKHVLAYNLMKWIFEHGAEKIVTNCPEGKIARLALELGMKVYGKENQTVFFEVRPWELEPQ